MQGQGENNLITINEARTLLEAGRSRRHFLRVATGAVLAGATLTALPLSMARALAQTSDFVEKDKFTSGATYTSGVFKVGALFTAVGVYWEVKSGDAKKIHIAVRTSNDGVTFGDWLDSEFDGDGKGDPKTQSPQTRFYGRAVLSSGQYAQYQVTVPGDVALGLVGLSFLDGSPGLVSGAPSTPEPGQPPVINRGQWGANESLRFENGSEVWPREYRNQVMILVHHSETSNVYQNDPSSDIRSIYYYHAVTKGWGDIGYNYLIDWKGNIYEGRYGGDNVVAGHALQYSWGSVGVCLIGSFKTTKPTDAQMGALIKLAAWKCGAKNINPLARIYFVDRPNVATISGHRDVLDTACPGQAAYDLLPYLRGEVNKLLPSDNGSYAAELTFLRFSPTTLPGGQTLRIDATIKNTGSKTLEAQGPAPGFTYEEGQDYVSQNFPKVSNKFRFTVDFGGTDSKPYPYRWGLGKDLPPGESVSITGYIKLNTKMVTEYYGGIVQEYVKYHQENVSRQPVSVIAPGYPTDKAASRANDTNIRYYPQTGHNLGYAFRGYWEKYGGLPLFGYPITEEFYEVSPTDNKTYIVQYFERNRFEYHPENKGTPYEVLLGLLGVQLTQERTFPKSVPFQSTADKRYFPETQHSLGGSFLRYWNKNGGLPIFGFPISEEFQEKNPDDGKTYTVQYFERNRFEWHPEYVNTQFEVLLGLLGKDVLRRRGWLGPGL